MMVILLCASYPLQLSIENCVIYRDLDLQYKMIMSSVDISVQILMTEVPIEFSIESWISGDGPSQIS